MILKEIKDTDQYYIVIKAITTNELVELLTLLKIKYNIKPPDIETFVEEAIDDDASFLLINTFPSYKRTCFYNVSLVDNEDVVIDRFVGISRLYYFNNNLYLSYVDISADDITILSI